MKITTAPQNVSTFNSPTPTALLERTENQRSGISDQTAEERLTTQIFQDGSGKKLIKFCRELSSVLIRSYDAENGVGELREKLCASIMVTLSCTEKQALSLIELSLELIHAKLHGAYRRTDIELSYLIAAATGAVNDVSSN